MIETSHYVEHLVFKGTKTIVVLILPVAWKPWVERLMLIPLVNTPAITRPV